MWQRQKEKNTGKVMITKNLNKNMHFAAAEDTFVRNQNSHGTRMQSGTNHSQHFYFKVKNTNSHMSDW